MLVKPDTLGLRLASRRLFTLLWHHKSSARGGHVGRLRVERIDLIQAMRALANGTVEAPERISTGELLKLGIRVPAKRDGSKST